jgi:hypothetical protein
MGTNIVKFSFAAVSFYPQLLGFIIFVIMLKKRVLRK